MKQDQAILDAQNETCRRKFVWLPTLDLYVLREFMIPFSILLFGFTFLFLIGDIFNYLSDFLEAKSGFKTIVQFFLLKMPGNIRFVLPISVLLACMYTLANFGRSKEITAMRSSGLSLIRCGVAIFFVGFMVMLVNYWFNELLVPQSERKSAMILEKISDPDHDQSQYNMLQYRSADNMRDWLFQNFDNNAVQHGVILKQYVRHGKVKNLRWKISASTARYIPGKGWLFKNVIRTEFLPLLRIPGNPERFPELLIESKDVPERPEDILNAVRPPDELPSWVIFAMLRNNNSMVPMLRGMYETILYYRLAFPTVCFLCVFLGLPLAAKNERAGIFISIITAVGVIVIYQVLTEVFLILGKQGYIPSIIGGLAPTVIFVLYGWFCIVRKAE